jgi:hypothetical protein
VLDLPRSLFDRLDDELTRSVRIINHTMRKSFDTNKITKEELQRELDAADRQYGQHTTSWQGETLIVDWPDQPQMPQVRITVSPIDRIKAKALQARQIVPDAIKAVEGDLDSLISEKAAIDQKRAAAMAPHQEAVAGLKSELDGIKSALDILSNGGPDGPLPGSGNG